MSANGVLNTPANDDKDSLKSQKQSINSTTPSSSSSFGLTLKQLQELMELKNVEVKKKVDEEYGGLKSFALKLKTDTMRGLTGESNDLALRTKEFGKNQIPPKPAKSIFRLAFEALQDTTLIMLMICAVISIGLSFYHPPSDAVEEENSRTGTSDTTNLDWIEGVAVSRC
jgi:P-type Ca2+ transporter type 2B